MKKNTIASLVVAGGKGTRMHSRTPKQFITINGIPIVIHALLPFEHHPKIATIAVVMPERYHEKTTRFLKQYGINKLCALAPAGRTRQLSVHHGLQVLKKSAPHLVVIHDAARPLVTLKLIDRVLSEAKRSGAASAAIEINDTVILKKNAQPLDRQALLRIQTPQAYDFSLLLKAHLKAKREGRVDYSDDASLMRSSGVQTTFVQGNVTNLKITSKEDLVFARAMMQSR